MLFYKPDKSVASRQRILSLAARCVCSRVAEHMVLPSTIEPIVSSMKRFAKALYLKGTEASNPPSPFPSELFHTAPEAYQRSAYFFEGEAWRILTNRKERRNPVFFTGK